MSFFGFAGQYGLYSSYIGCFLYVLLGSCRQVTIGPTAVMGLLIYETCGNNFPECTVLTAFYGGVFELLMAVLQLGETKKLAFLNFEMSWWQTNSN